MLVLFIFYAEIRNILLINLNLSFSDFKYAKNIYYSGVYCLHLIYSQFFIYFYFIINYIISIYVTPYIKKMKITKFVLKKKNIIKTYQMYSLIIHLNLIIFC